MAFKFFLVRGNVHQQLSIPQYIAQCATGLYDVWEENGCIYLKEIV